jgi:hypothetical protein
MTNFSTKYCGCSVRCVSNKPGNAQGCPYSDRIASLFRFPLSTTSTINTSARDTHPLSLPTFADQFIIRPNTSTPHPYNLTHNSPSSSPYQLPQSESRARAARLRLTASLSRADGLLGFGNSISLHGRSHPRVRSAGQRTADREFGIERA